MTKYKVEVEGLGFPEGPVSLPDGSIAFVDLTHQKIRRFHDGDLTELSALEGSPNGMRLGADGHLYVCNNGGLRPSRAHGLMRAEPEISGRVQRVALDGTVADVAVDLPGAKPSRPNDLQFTPEGDIVFTDPQNWETLGSAPDRYHGGQLLKASLQGEVEVMAEMEGFPNGLVFHPDGSLLVGTSVGHKLFRFSWESGRAGAAEEWQRFDDRFGPDGMAVHEDRIYLAGSVGDRIAVLDLSGRLIRMIDMGWGSDPTNLCIHQGLLWVTLGYPGQLVSMEL
ncbi:SMP-30/gluconolactonase/LRE family protein [Rhodoligotrophos defluvii]|uniref:SMP-30/gluconolactonase/LRE family protein n=1 Tax=Rhodoligotrophos defluvii TaxID=2561934 RepID=UPI00148574ED|nr:SMP-30/gluconolactonase/LRE family protein [Rhodoligotrophos defluvii]